MGMSIDKAIAELELLKKNTFSCMSAHQAFITAIDTMRKYRKIQEIINNAKDLDGAVKYNWLYEQIREILEDGKID